MGNESGTRIMYGLDEDDPECILHLYWHAASLFVTIVILVIPTSNENRENLEKTRGSRFFIS